MFGDKFHFRNYDAEVHIDSPKEYYLSGDHVSGTFVVTARSSLTVSNIQVKLRCDEDAYVYVSDGNGGHYEHNRERYISVDSTVFPEHPVPYGSTDEQPRFTLKEGSHTFNFDFEIPLGPGSIPNFDYMSSLSWYVKGVVHRGAKLSKAVRASSKIDVCPYIKTPMDLSNMNLQSETATINAYLSGYNERVKSSAGRLKEIFSYKSDLRRYVDVTGNLRVPADGIPQSPATLPVEVDISSADEELLFVTKFELDLKYKLIATASGASENNRNVLRIMEMDVKLPVKSAISAIQEQISRTTIEQRLPATFKSDHIDLRYKLVATIYITSKEHQNHVKKIRVSIPALMRHKCDYTEEVPPPYVPENPESKESFPPEKKLESDEKHLQMDKESEINDNEKK